MLCSLFSKRKAFYFLFQVWITLQNSRLTFEVVTATSHSPQLSWKKRFIYNIVWRFRTACCKAHFRLEVHINRQQLMEIVAFAILHDSNSFKSMVVLFLAGRNVTLHKMAKLNRCRSKLFYSPSSGFRYWLTSLMSFTSDAAIVSVHIGHTVSPDSSKLKTTTTTTQTNMFSLIRDYHRTAVPTVGFRGHTMWRVGQSPRWQYPVAKFIFCSMPKLGKKYAENENLGVGVLIKKRWRRRTHKHFPPHQFGMQSREGAVWTHAPVLFRHMSTLWSKKKKELIWINLNFLMLADRCFATTPRKF